MTSLTVNEPYALVDSLRLQRFGRSDPCVMVERGAGQERYAKCARTPEGPVTLVAWARSAELRGDSQQGAESRLGGQARIEIALYGAGADWLLPRLPMVLGTADPADFVPVHPRLASWRIAFRATRLTRAISLAELHAILILQQRIAFKDAARSWRSMVELCAERAPGPLPLLVPPGPEAWLALRQPRARALGIDARRWSALQHAARASEDIDACADDRGELRARAERLPGTGPWTIGFLLGLGTADADAIVRGDLHLPRDVSALLTGVPIANDDDMVSLLEPFRPHRFRVVRVMLAGGRRRP